MVQRTSNTLAALYEADETAWLEATADLVRRGLYDQLDTENLSEYLSDMAKRDRREVESRLIVLLAHVLKWVHQPDRRSGSWHATIIEQCQELEGLLGRGVLYNHAESVLPASYLKAVKRAVVETGKTTEDFPVDCPYSLDQLLTANLFGEADAE